MPKNTQLASINPWHAGPGTSLLSLLSLYIKRIATGQERCQTACPTMKITSEISCPGSDSIWGPAFRPGSSPACCSGGRAHLRHAASPSLVLQPPALFVVSVSSPSSARSLGLGCGPGCLGRAGRPGLSLWRLTRCSGTERKGREVELSPGSCWDASGRDPGSPGTLAQVAHPVLSNTVVMVIIGV